MDYIYFWTSLILSLVTIGIALKQKDYRREILFMGIVVGLAGIVSEYFFFGDYWKPPLVLQFGSFGGIEDFLFGFTAGGIGTWLPRSLLHAKLSEKRVTKRIWIFPLIAILQFLVLFVFQGQVNSIVLSSIGLLLPAIIIFALRKDLIYQGIIGAFLGGTILILIEGVLLRFLAPNYLEQYFLLHDKGFVLLGTFPITEFVWGFLFNLCISVTYDFARGKKYSYKSMNLFKEKSGEITNNGRK